MAGIVDASSYLARISERIKSMSNNKDFFEEKKTVPFDSRFPNQNQSRHCYASYIDFHRCKNRHGEEHEACKYYKWVYSTMCPNAWIQDWDEQVNEGTFGGPI